MRQVIGVLLGMLLSGGTSLLLGAILFRKISAKLERTEYFSLAFVAGSACFSQIVFLFCSIGLARRSVFIAVGLLAVIATAVVNRTPVVRPVFPPMHLRWKWLFGVLFVSFGIVYLVNAMAPEMSPDGSAYHLPFVARYLRTRGFERITGNLYASLSQGIELLFLPAFSVGRHSAAAMVHFLFLLDLPLMMICYGRRYGFPVPAATAAFLVFASPLAGWDGTSAYVDVAAAAILFALFYLLQIWDAGRTSSLLIPIGILAGFSYAAKYSAAIAVPYALGSVIWKLRRARNPWLRPVAATGALAAFFILPWMMKDAIFVGNPLAPFANALFPNPYLHVSFEQQYLFYLRHYHLTSHLYAPWELTVKGERLQGFFGPVFLLLPLALLALRRTEGRRLLLAGMVFAIPWSCNIGARFLIPALPPLTLALAIALAGSGGLLAAITVLHAVLSWYATPVRYFDDYAPRLTAFPFRAAFRIESEEGYLTRHHSGYLVDRMIERQVARGEKVFSFEQISEAWTTRQILVSSGAAENERLADILRSALCRGACPARALDFHFPPRPLRRLRATQSSPAPQIWSISEFQIFAGGSPLPIDGNWHFNAYPNPWDAQLAFDGSLVTRWRSWQAAAPGMFLDVDFGEPQLVDEVRLLTTSDVLQTRVDLRGMDAGGAWQTLPVQWSGRAIPITDDLRAAAVRELLARGIRYLLVSPGTIGANEFRDNAADWGIQLVDETEGTRLYLLGARQTGSPLDAVTAPEPAVPPGAYDDSDTRMLLRAAWTRDSQFQDAYHHTLTYSNIPGASVSLASTGNAITYVYTRARNRGIAEVLVDGRLRDRVDLYAPDTAWASRTRYDSLGPGTHVIQIRVTGEKNPRASDCFVDLDALIIESGENP